jgi:hypothetical protein
MLFDLNKDYIFQNVLCFIFLLIVVNKLNITLKHIYSFIIVILLCYFYYKNTNNELYSKKIDYINDFEKDNFNSKEINNLSRPYDENLIEANDIKNESGFNLF